MSPSVCLSVGWFVGRSVIISSFTSHALLEHLLFFWVLLVFFSFFPDCIALKEHLLQKIMSSEKDKGCESEDTTLDDDPAGAARKEEYDEDGDTTAVVDFSQEVKLKMTGINTLKAENLDR